MPKISRNLVAHSDGGDFRCRDASLHILLHPCQGSIGRIGEFENLLVGNADGQADVGVVEGLDHRCVVVEDFDVIDVEAADEICDFRGTGKVVGDATVVEAHERTRVRVGAQGRRCTSQAV